MSIPALEELVEPLTTQLVRLVEGDIEGVTLSAGDCSVRFAGGPSDLGLAAVPAPAAKGAAQLNDIQSVLLFSMGFDLDEESSTGADTFFKEYELEEGDEWEEQTLREFALEALGILCYVFERPDPGRYAITPL